MSDLNGFEQRKLKKMKQIETATIHLLNAKEIANISMHEIAQNAHVSKVTLFNYYQSKEKLMNKVFVQTFQNVYRSYEKVLEKDFSFEQTLQETTRLKVEALHLMNEQFFQNTLTQFADKHSFYNKVVQLNKGFASKLIQKGRKEGKINPAYDDELVLMYLQIFIEGSKSVKWRLEKMEEQGRLLTQMLLNSLR